MSSHFETEPLAIDRTATDGPGELAGLKILGSETLGQRVHSELRTFLMEGGARPGQKLTLRQLTSAFGTSPMPVREAVQRLAAEGALEVLPNRTIRVPLMTRSKFQELRRIRIALEGMAISEAARVIETPEIGRLETLNAAFVEEMQKTENSPGRLFHANKEFHFTIYRAARMPLLMSMIENLWLQIGPMLHFSLGLRGREATNKFAPDCHQQMLHGLSNRDSEAARQGLETDIMDAGDLILRVGNLSD